MTIDDLKQQHATLIAYILAKVRSAEWRDVVNGAIDITEVEAQLAILRDLEKQGLRPASEAEVEAASPKWASRLG